MVPAGTAQFSLWSSFVDLCDNIAPYCGVICFLAPLPTINQISRDRTVGNLPLLPYSSMVANSFLWVIYGVMKNLPSVYTSNSVGVLLGMYYFAVFVRNCGPMASNLPGTVEQHLKGASAVTLFNLCLAASGVKNVSDAIGKEGVLLVDACLPIDLFTQRFIDFLAVHHFIRQPALGFEACDCDQVSSFNTSAFHMACLTNCLAWFVVGWWKIHDFNIYFPNIMGLGCAVTQLVLKGMYGNHPPKDLPK
ncbi:hypothetical protein ACHAWF_004548 [Thalassiosira exigua]